MERDDRTTRQEPKIGFPPAQTHDVVQPSDAYKTHPDPAAQTTPRRAHAGMDPEVQAAARESDVPDADVYDRPLNERASNMNLYAAVAITVIIAIVVAMLIWALVA